jgi:hypothetical protein
MGRVAQYPCPADFMSRADVALTPRSPLAPAPLTFVQQSWWKRTTNGESVADCRVIQVTLRLLGPLRVECLQRSLRDLTRRHEPLRTRIVTASGTPHQIVDPPDSSNLEFLRLEHASKTQSFELAKRLAGEFIYQPLDFSVMQLFGAKVIQVANNDHVLILAMCHHIADEISVRVLTADLRALYAASACGRQCTLRRCNVQLADYAAWQERSSPAWEAKHRAYWSTHLAGAKPLELPIDGGVTGVDPGQTDSYPLYFGIDLRNRLCALARSQQTLLSMTVLTVYAAVMLRACLVDTALLPIMIYGRHRPELTDMIGAFSYCLPLRVEITERTTFCDLLHELTREFAVASEHQDYGRMALQARDLTMHGSFNWVHRHGKRAARHRWQTAFGKDVTVQRVGMERKYFRDVATRDLAFRFEVGFIDKPEGIFGGFGYRSDLFRRRTFQGLASALGTFLEICLANPGCPISSARIDG